MDNLEPCFSSKKRNILPSSFVIIGNSFVNVGSDIYKNCLIVIYIYIYIMNPQGKSEKKLRIKILRQ